MDVIIKVKIKEQRRLNGISVRELADMTGLSKTFISDIENSHKIPTLYTLCLIAANLGVNPNTLYTYRIIE